MTVIFVLVAGKCKRTMARTNRGHEEDEQDVEEPHTEQTVEITSIDDLKKVTISFNKSHHVQCIHAYDF